MKLNIKFRNRQWDDHSATTSEVVEEEVSEFEAEDETLGSINV